MNQARGHRKDDDPLVAVVGGGRVESVEETARTVHEAVRRALQQLGKAEDEVDVTVVSRGSPPQILAFGAEPAQVRVTVKPETPAPAEAGNRATCSTAVRRRGRSGRRRNRR